MNMHSDSCAIGLDLEVYLTYKEITTLQALAVVNDCTVADLVTRMIRKYTDDRINVLKER